LKTEIHLGPNAVPILSAAADLLRKGQQYLPGCAPRRLELEGTVRIKRIAIDPGKETKQARASFELVMIDEQGDEVPTRGRVDVDLPLVLVTELVDLAQRKAEAGLASRPGGALAETIDKMRAEGPRKVGVQVVERRGA